MAGSRRHRTGLVHRKPTPLPPVRNEINVTPLVDVCLVLLIIFMVITPMLQRGRDVPLPKSKNFREQKDTGKKPIVSVSRSGAQVQYWFDKDRVQGSGQDEQLANITKKVEDALSKPGVQDTSVFVKADANLKFGDVYPVLMAIHEGRSEDVQLGVWEVKEGQ
jgi:biopolymer transport protein ExbD